MSLLKILGRDDAGNTRVIPELSWSEEHKTLVGRGPNDPPACPTIDVNLRTGKTGFRSTFNREQGDSADSADGRSGPNGVQTGPMRTTGSGERIMRRAGLTFVELVPGDKRSDGWNGLRPQSATDPTLVQDYALVGEVAWVADGEQTPTSRPGKFVVRITRPNAIAPTESGDFEFSRQGILARVPFADGGLLINDGGTFAVPRYRKLSEWIGERINAGVPAQAHAVTIEEVRDIVREMLPKSAKANMLPLIVAGAAAAIAILGLFF